MIDLLTTALPYLLEASLCMGGFYLLFLMLHRRDTFFTMNRLYLLLTLLVSLVLPLIELTPQTVSAVPEILVDPVGQIAEPVLISPSGFTIWNGLAILYGIGVLLGLTRFGIRLGKLAGIIIRGKKQTIGNYEVILTNGKYPTSSFYTHILWDNTRDDFTPEEHRSIIRHELVHIRQGHSTDNLIIELLKCFFWFNPIVYLYNKELKLVHEFLADKDVLADADSTLNKEYEKLMGKQLLSNSGYQLTNNFNMSNLKTRLTMISKQKTHKLALLKNILVLPVAVLALLLSQETLMAQGTGGDEVITELSTDEGKVNLIQLEGVYHGKNIYVQNPYHPSGVGYSIQSVSINGDRVDQDLNYDSFELDLSHLDDGDQVIIEIVCAAGSLAKILNPEDLER